MEPLYTDEDAPRNTSAKFKLCWDTAAAFCKEIPITDDLGWAKDFFGICENLGWIHGNCCGTMGLTEDDQRLMLGAADIPNQVDHLPNSGSVRVLYAWIQSAQRVLHKWSSDLKSRNLTLQDVSSYKKGYNLIRRVAVGVSANQLLITNTELKDYIEAHSTVSKKLAGYLICQVPDHPEIRWYGESCVSHQCNLEMTLLLFVSSLLSREILSSGVHCQSCFSSTMASYHKTCLRKLIT